MWETSRLTVDEHSGVFRFGIYKIIKSVLVVVKDLIWLKACLKADFFCLLTRLFLKPTLSWLNSSPFNTALDVYCLFQTSQL